MSQFRGKTALLVTGVRHLHLLAVVPQPMMVGITGRDHDGVSPAYVGLGRFSIWCDSYWVDFQ